jgi:anti-sigma B factor antagonist
MDAREEPGIGVLTLTGELIAESRLELDRVLREWHEAGRVRVIACCAELTYLDSAGLSTLLGALHRFRRAGGDLLLAEMNPSLNAIFELTSMEKYFKIFPSMAEARAHFQQMAAQRVKSARGRGGKTPTRG